MKIEMNKTYHTRDGEPVRIICTDRDELYSVVGMIGTSVHVWTEDGIFDLGRKSSLDLIEVKPYDFEIGEPVLVYSPTNGLGWLPRHFAGVSANGKPMTFVDGKSQWSASSSSIRTVEWDKCRRPTKEELAEANITKKDYTDISTDL